ncbi:MAG: DUF6493 family protein [Bacteroidota bacterium]
MNSATELFTSLIEKGKEEKVISFLQTVTSEQKKELVPVIKTLAKEYNQFGSLGGNSYGYIKGKEEHRVLLQIASFVCFNKADYEKSHFSIWMLDPDRLNKVIDWYVPGWFSDFVNKQADLEYIPYYISYDMIMELDDKGAIQPSKELIAKLLPNIIFEQDKNRNWSYVPQNLLKRSVTLSEHFWYLFDVETNLHYSDRYIFFGNEKSKETIGWYPAILQYSGEGKIDRLRLLRESLLASNKNFNKVASGWFAELFMELNPVKREIIEVQKELFGVLNAPHSKPVNTALKAIKEILAEKEFDVAGFLDTVPALLTSDVKATVNAVLMILEKIAKKHKSVAAQIAQLSCHALVHADDGLQQRAAKLISTIYPQANELIQQELEPYRDTLLSSARVLLDHILTSTEPAGNQLSGTVSTQAVAGEPQAIPAIETIDDLIFLASQVFDNNQPWHIAVFPAELVRRQKEIRHENITRFEPALQRALKLMRTGINSQQGYLDHMLALFFIDVCIYWIRNYPGESIALKEMFEKADTAANDKTKWLNVQPDASYLASWKHHDGLKAFNPHKEMLQTILEKIKKQNLFPVLSAPTHAPGWIDPIVFTKKLIEYKSNNQPPYNIDLQLAVSRCRLDNPSEAIRLAEEKLSGEFCNLLLFLFNKHKTPQPPFNIPTMWMMASLAKRQKKIYPEFESFPWYNQPFTSYTGQRKWETVTEEYTYQRYDYQTRKNENVKDKRKILRLFRDTNPVKEESGLRKFLQKFTGTKEEPPKIPALCEWMEFKTKWIGNEYNDIQRLILLTPNNPEPLLADIINECLDSSVFVSESDKRLVTATLQLLHELWNDSYGEMAHLFLATCLISGDKTIGNIAAEIWITSVTNKTINSELIGEIIGKHESIEFAPLKRFTDLVMQQLFRISAVHNHALLIMIENILKRLPPEPINNLKKLLEIYVELLSLENNRKPDSTVVYKLDSWKQSPSIEKVADKLLKMQIKHLK